MAKSKGNRKGRPLELRIAKRFSLWWTNGKDDFIFYHSHVSGALATNRAKRNKKTRGHHGDLAVVHPSGAALMELLVVECKKGYGSSSIFDLIDRPRTNSNYAKWIIKARLDAKAAGTPLWVIIHERDRSLPIIIFPEKLYRYLGYPEGYVSIINLSKKSKVGRTHLGVMVLEDFLNIFTKEDVREAVKELRRRK